MQGDDIIPIRVNKRRILLEKVGAFEKDLTNNDLQSI